jgi:hypothetical protein
MSRRPIIAVLSAGCLVALAACGNQNTSLEQGALTTGADALGTYESGGTKADVALAVVADTFNVYKNTANPSQTVIAEATKLLTAAQAAVAASDAAPADTARQAAEASAIQSLATYLLTAAPGNGVTPASATAS